MEPQGAAHPRVDLTLTLTLTLRPSPTPTLTLTLNPTQVQHILASTSHSGLSVVWDLKLKKPVISFQDPNNKTQRNSVVSWNPEAATEVLVASADDRSPVLQIWDLRNATMPVRPSPSP